MIKIIATTLLGYAVWLALAFFAISGVASAQTPYDAIKAKDGKAHAEQFQDAVNENIRPALRGELAPLVAAIRYAENGRAGREYGILHPRVKPTYRSQAGWCAATVQKNYDRWVKAGRKGEFVVFLGNRYCPIGADNDPNNLNRHWIGNVRKFHARFK
jgi:hypothetical protein